MHLPKPVPTLDGAPQSVEPASLQTAQIVLLRIIVRTMDGVHLPMTGAQLRLRHIASNQISVDSQAHAVSPQVGVLRWSGPIANRLRSAQSMVYVPRLQDGARQPIQTTVRTHGIARKTGIAKRAVASA